MKNFIAVFGLLILLTACNTTKGLTIDEEGVSFVRSDKLMTVLEKAKEEDKLIFVDFYTTWCLPCKMMDEDVFTDKNVANYMNQHFINYKVDAERGGGPNLALIYQVNVFPTLLFLDADGQVLVRKEGAAYQTELRRLAEEALLASSVEKYGG